MATTATSRVVKSVSPLGFPFRTPDPFLFCVYHHDKFPAAKSDNMEAPRRGNGADFDWSAPYRMYHGDKIPGFPQHPHAGFETLSAVLDGTIDHADSAGNGGRYGAGDLQWMTAGRGIRHGEMFPLVHTDKANTLKMFQIWLNLPRVSKRVDPYFTMHWAERAAHVPGEGGASATVFAGTLGAAHGQTPPPGSWAADPANDVGVFFVTLPPRSRFVLPAAASGSAINRVVFVVSSAEGATSVAGERIAGAKATVEVRADAVAELHNAAPAGGAAAELLVLQGRPIGEPVAQEGPFVANTREEIARIRAEYHASGGYGGWPWPRDDMVFARGKSRFASRRAADGTTVEEIPPVQSPDAAGEAKPGEKGEL